MAKIIVCGTQYNGNLGLPVGAEEVNSPPTELDGDWSAIAHTSYNLYALSTGGVLAASGPNGGLAGLGFSGAGTWYGLGAVAGGSGIKAISTNEIATSSQFLFAQKTDNTLRVMGSNSHLPNLGIAAPPYTVDALTQPPYTPGGLMKRVSWRQDGMTKDDIWLLIDSTIYAVAASNAAYSSVMSGVRQIVDGTSTPTDYNRFILKTDDTLIRWRDGVTNTVATGVKSVSRRNGCDNGYVFFVKLDGTLWRIGSMYASYTPIQIGTDADWDWVGGGDYNNFFAKKTNGSGYKITTSTGATTQVFDSAQGTLLDMLKVGRNYDAYVLLYEPPVPPTEFWQSLVGAHETI